MEMRITVGGGAEYGWIVDIHDGTRNGVYRPDASNATAGAAAIAAVKEHEGFLDAGIAAKADEDKAKPANDKGGKGNG